MSDPLDETCPKCAGYIVGNIEPCVCRANATPPPGRLVHPVDRQDGDNPDGNPGTIALLDELLEIAEETCEALDYLWADAVLIEPLSAKAIARLETHLAGKVEDIRHKRSEIELRG